PEPPTPENRVTRVPSGAISTAESAESVWNAMLSPTVTLATLNVLFELGMVRGTVRTPGPEELAAGIAWAMASEAKGSGPVMGPTGRMIESTWSGVNVLTCIGRSNVTWNRLVLSFISRLSAPVEGPLAPTAWVLATCGPGTIIGRVFWSNGPLRMLAAVNV